MLQTRLIMRSRDSQDSGCGRGDWGGRLVSHVGNEVGVGVGEGRRLAVREALPSCFVPGWWPAFRQ